MYTPGISSTASSETGKHKIFSQYKINVKVSGFTKGDTSISGFNRKIKYY